MNLKGINHIVIIIGTESNKIMKYGNIMKSPVTYKAPMGSLYYTRCTMDLPRGHIIVYRPHLYHKIFQMRVFFLGSFKYGRFLVFQYILKGEKTSIFRAT